jgi:hypothetical protein
MQSFPEKDSEDDKTKGGPNDRRSSADEEAVHSVSKSGQGTESGMPDGGGE